MTNTDVLLVVGGLAIVAAAYAIVLTHSSWVRRLPEFLTALPAWVGSIGFTLWGLAYFALQVQLALSNDTSSPQFFASEANQNAVWGLFWYSLFITWGLSLGAAGFYFYRLRKCEDGAALDGACRLRGLAMQRQNVNANHVRDTNTVEDGGMR